jgi:uncharacterized OsmC-like protein/alpha-beta hydrolase superfamily lysophospholipase
MNSRKVNFENRTGEKLAGIMDLPDDGAPVATALFAHCFTCSKDLKSVTRISQMLNMAGIAVLRFDFTGLGDSDGDFTATNFSTSIDDICAAARYLADTGMPPNIAIGHSLGGAAILMAAPRIASLDAVVTIGAPGQADHVTRLFAGQKQELESTGEAVVSIGGRPFKIRQQLIDDLNAQSGPERAEKLRLPLLVLHSPVDKIVGIDNAAEIFTRAMHPKSFVSLDKADHLLSDEADARYVGSLIATWSTRYIGMPADQATEIEPTDAVIATTGPKGFRTSINAHGHGLVADEPRSVGGSDAGTTPYGLLGSALASCTSMTLQMYARRKGLDLDTASVTVSHEKVHAEDCEHCTSKAGKIDRFDRHVTLTGELSAAERDRLLEIADMCPVHRTLEGEIEIRTFATAP